MSWALVRMLFLALLLPIGAAGQELIPNGSFETFDNCPQKDNLLFEARPWYNPNKATPDFYHYCFPTAQIEVPPRTGSGLARLFMDFGWAEYLSTPLKEPLKAGEAYQFELYVSSATPNRYPAESFGAYFSTQALSSAEKDLLTLTGKPQFIDNVPQRLTKRFGWEKVGGCLTARGGESHVTIGNFSKLPVSLGLGYYYLFVDDVSLVPIRMNLGKDTTLCGAKSTLLLNAETPGAIEYKWNNGSSAPTLRVAKPGKYWVEVTTPCKVLRDTITVNYRLDFSLGPDTTLCDAATLPLRVSQTGTYQWQDGSTQNNFLVKQAGTYRVQVADGTCTVSDTIRVRYVRAPRLDLGPDQQLCGTEVYTVLPTIAEGKFRWLDPYEQVDRVVAQSGVYRAAVTNDCATVTDSVRVDYNGCECTIFTPDAFSPNADGLNDLFTPVACNDIRVQSLAVYNRWGELIFQTSRPPFAWDGTFRGAPCPAAVYTWHIDYQIQQADKPAEARKMQNRLLLVR
ncbi:T9SS C-terminal target domain-containing protein [Rudanella lutea]|uniref:T9SS C-terminal target domain-containing protein n=1 Tax=Rudanella lutea TaxID=451374 RepID=UPI000363EFFA|nr:T9SS C-terminal target domain-containing protein [Rudanella lutea]